MRGVLWPNLGGEGFAHEKLDDVVSAGVSVNVLRSHELVKIVDMIIVHKNGGARWPNSGRGHTHEKVHDVISAGVPVDVLWSCEQDKIVDMMIEYLNGGYTLV